jgi:hypothetical protein
LDIKQTGATVARSSLGNLLLASLALASVLGWTPWNGAIPHLCGNEPLLFGNRGFDPYNDNPTQEVEIRRLQFFPDSLIYHPYLAGPREPRTGIQFFSNDDGGWSWFSTVGGQIGLLRYGTYDAFRPQGLQLDIEGAAQFRSSNADMFNFASTNVRFGFPLTVGWGSQETKLELCFFRAEAAGSNAEYLPYPMNQVFQQEAMVLGHSIHLTDMLRVYGEAIYLLHSNQDGNWEFQFGTELAPVDPTRLWGSPFAAANVYLLEQENYGGNLMLQAGWLWRGRDARMLRVGVFYSNGLSNSSVLVNANEQQIGFGLWRDY